MTELSGRKVLVTGASWLVAFPVAAALARSNEVYALARWSDAGQKRMIEAAEYVLKDLGFHDVRVRHHELPIANCQLPIAPVWRACHHACVLTLRLCAFA